MTDTQELPLESQAKLADLSVSLTKFFETIDTLKTEVADLKTQVSALNTRIRHLESNHATH